MQEVKKCLYCEKEFETQGSDVICKLFCCRSCSDKYRRRQIKPYKIIEKKCEECGNIFHPKYGYEEKTMFCSKKCKITSIQKRLGKEHLKQNKKNYNNKVKNNKDLYSANLAYKRYCSTKPISRFRAYKVNAIKRNIEFSLSFNQFLTFWDSQCHYCGTKIEGVGVDRVDSSIGYEIKNCVPCCKTCNYMKLNLSLSDFLSHIQKILNNTAQVKSLGSSKSA